MQKNRTAHLLLPHKICKTIEMKITRLLKNFIRMVKAMITLTKPKSWRSFLKASEISKGFDHSFNISWSQCAEDLAILSAVQYINKGRYIDIGAHHPSRYSVTRHLYQNGWCGVNIEANSYLLPKFFLERPRDENIWAAVGKKREYELSVLSESGMSTTSKDWMDQALAHNIQLIDVIKVPGISLRQILDQHFSKTKCNLLCIDIEGADLEALESIEFESLELDRHPDWLLLETFPPVQSALETDSVRFAMDNGYFPYLVLPMSTLLKKAS